MNNIDLLQPVLTSLGYKCTLLELGENKEKFLQIVNPNNDKAVTISGMSPLYPFPTASSRLICKMKDLSNDYAAKLGITIPKTAYVTSINKLPPKMMNLLNKGALIVKPKEGSLSRGLTLDVTSIERLESAIKKAQKYSPVVIVQEQVKGDEIRFVIVGGKPKAAILRQTPRVVGDGKLSIAALVQEENQARKRIQGTLVLYPQLGKSMVDAALLNSSRVPARGEIVELNKSTMISGGASVYDITDQVHPSYFTQVEHLARGLGEGFLVADLIVSDYKQQARNDTYWFIEFNLTPALRLFYSCRDGRHLNVIEDSIVPMMQRTLQ